MLTRGAVVLHSELICLTERNDNKEIDAVTKTLAEASERKSHLINTNQYEAAGAVHTETLVMEAKRANLCKTGVRVKSAAHGKLPVASAAVRPASDTELATRMGERCTRA